MNAAETIQAAIDKLTRLRDKSTPGAWKRSGSYVEEADPANPEDRFDVLPLTIFRIEESDHDADLVVTLHATIDAQLAILQVAREAERRTWPGDAAPWTRGHILPLARAILREQVDA